MSALDMADVPVAILAGGFATRLRPITEKIPKALVEVAGKPFIDHQLDLLHRHGARKAVILVGYRGDMLQEHVGDGSRWGMEVRCVFDGPVPLGTAGALRDASELLGEVYWVLYGDSYLDIDYRDILTDFSRRPEAVALMTVLANENRWDRSNVIFEGGKLLRYDKKTQTPEMHHIDYGLAILRREALGRLPKTGPADLAELYTGLVTDRLMVGYEVRQRFYEIGSPEGLEETRQYLLRVPEPGTSH